MRTVQRREHALSYSVELTFAKQAPIAWYRCDNHDDAEQYLGELHARAHADAAAEGRDLTSYEVTIIRHGTACDGPPDDPQQLGSDCAAVESYILIPRGTAT